MNGTTGTALAPLFSAIAVAHAAVGETELVTPHFGRVDRYDSVINLDVSADGRFVSFCPGRHFAETPRDHMRKQETIKSLICGDFREIEIA